MIKGYSPQEAYVVKINPSTGGVVDRLEFVHSGDLKSLALVPINSSPNLLLLSLGMGDYVYIATINVASSLTYI